MTQAVDEQRRFVAVAGSRHQGRDDVTIAVADRDDLIPFVMLVPVASEVVSAFLGGGTRAVAMDDLQIEKVGFFQGEYGCGEDRRDHADGFEKIKGAVNVGVVDFRLAVIIFLDRQLFPLTSGVEKRENVVHQIEPR